MADILIRGIERPRERSLWLCIKTDGTVYNIKPGGIGIAHAVGTAVSLPEGHGKLGDLDALSESLAESATFNYNKRTSVTWADAFESMIDILEEADTIVPADVTDIDVGSKKEGGGEE